MKKRNPPKKKKTNKSLETDSLAELKNSLQQQKKALTKILKNIQDEKKSND